MNRRFLRLPLEAILYLVVLALGACLRLISLGWPPLTDAEATHALSAAAVTPFASPFWAEERAVPTSAAYHTLTAGLFQLGLMSDISARVIPALAGIGLVLVPLTFRRRIGAGNALAMAFLLAISPALVATSRTAGGDSLASLGILLAAGLVLGAEPGQSWRLPLAGASLGLALASGPSGLTGLLSLVLAAGVAALGWGMRVAGSVEAGEARASRDALLIGLAVLLGLAAGFGLLPSGLSALGEGLASWLRGWTSMGPVLLRTELAALPIYEPLTFVFGVIGIVFCLRERETVGTLAATWAAAALLVALAYPSRNPMDLLWTVMPLSYLAARALTRVIERVIAHWSWEAHGGLIAVLLALAGIAALQLAMYAVGRGPGVLFVEPWWGLAFAGVILFVIAPVMIVLFGAGWSRDSAVEGAGVALTLVLLCLGLSATWHLSLAPGAASSGELWRPQASTVVLPLFDRTLREISETHTGRSDAMPLAVAGEITPSLAWAIRDFPRFEAASIEDAPSIILAPAGSELAGLQADYVGQELAIGERWAWSGVLPPDPIAWLVRRQAPTQMDQWLLLVRVDVATFGTVTELPEQAP
jgi:hypothetical protein